MGSKKYAIVIVAAGASTRLGYPKQLVKWRKTTLLDHTIAEANKVGNADIYVILGSNYPKIIKSISQSATILFNPDWKEGMGSTIAFSAKKIYDSGYEGIIFSVCDQPFLSHTIFIDLIEAFKIGNYSIIMSKYDEQTGPPTLFSKIHLNELSKLKGDLGAKNVVKDNIMHVGYVDFKQGHIDIDTNNDLKTIN